MKTTVILVRHGESVWNREGRVQGQSDPPLTALGQAQAKQVAERLTMEQVELIFSSDSQRAAATAGAISQKLGLPVTQDSRLREISVGYWEGLLFKEAQERYAEEYATWRKDPTQGRGGGESRAELEARGWAAVADIVAANSGRNIVITSHGGTIQAITCHVLKIPAEHFQSLRGLENCAMTWLEFDEAGQARVKRYNVPAFGVAPLGDVEDELGEAQ